MKPMGSLCNACTVVDHDVKRLFITSWDYPTIIPEQGSL